MGKYDRDLTNAKVEKRKSDTIVVEDEDCISPSVEYSVFLSWTQMDRWLV